MFDALRRRARRAMSVAYWVIALRERKEGGVPLWKDGDTARFRAFPSEKYVTYADPFLFERDGVTWLFYERQDLTDMKGTLWCCRLCGDPAGERKTSAGSQESAVSGTPSGTLEECAGMGAPVKVLEEPFHLSYPQVFEWNGDVYMIPESRAAGEVRLYRAVEFPFDWEFAGTLIAEPCVDTTLLVREGLLYLYTYTDGRLRIYREARGAGRKLPGGADPEKSFSIPDFELICESEPDKTLRPGGRIIEDGERILRPSQDCRDIYGGALFFLEEVNDMLVTKPVLELTPDKLSIEGGEFRPVGIHTYNSSKRFETIDFLHREISIGVLLKKIKWKFFS